MQTLKTNCLPLLIGSLPVNDHNLAMDMILETTPEIPLWPQLPCFKEEGMVQQFLPGFPGIEQRADKTFIHAEGDLFDTEFLTFYEEYLRVTEGGENQDKTRFTLTPQTAKGFFEFLRRTDQVKDTLLALKAQTTGPFTFATGIVDQNDRAIFYSDQLRDAAIKLLALKASWQIRKMRKICERTIMFFDEPALAGFGSSAFISISAADIKTCLSEVFTGIHDQGGLTGVHVCANTEWSLLFDTQVDIISFDAYSYFDKFTLYPEHLQAFFNRGGIVASGIVPTTPELIDKETSSALTKKWLEQAAELTRIGIPLDQITSQTLITPSCGTGSISLPYAQRVMQMTREVSGNLRKYYSLE